MKIAWCLVLLAFIYGCVPDEVGEPFDDASHEYFPLIVGKYITYAVDSIVFDDQPGGNKKDTASFLLKEEVASIYVFNNDTFYYINRYRKNDPSENWSLTDVWTSRKSQAEALRTEENLTFRKMVFPLRDGRQWVATSYINPLTTVLVGTEYIQAFQDWQAEVTEYNIPGQAGQFSFDDDIMHIVQTDTDDGITKRFVFEKYARGIGLVERIDTIFDSRCITIGDFTPCLGKPWFEHAGKGYILSQVMTDHN